MDNKISVETSLFSTIQLYVSRHTSISSIFISACIALFGCVFIYLGMDLEFSSGTLSMLLFTAGTIMLLLALYRFFWQSQVWEYKHTGSIIMEGSFYLKIDDLNGFQNLLESIKQIHIDTAIFRTSGNIRLDYLMARDSQFAAIQLFKYVPYTYEPCSEAYLFQGDAAVSIVQYLKHIKK